MHHLTRSAAVGLMTLVFAACGGDGSDGYASVPPVPDDVTALVEAGEVTLSWGSVINADGYHLYYATESSLTPENYAAYQDGAWLSNVNSPHTVKGLSNDVDYFFIITAYNSNGESAAGAALIATPETQYRPLNDTGIERCAAASSETLACPVSGYRGQDGDLGRDAQMRAGALAKEGAGAAGFDFTKLDENGNSLPSGSAKWSCVKDNHTGLIWEVKTKDGGLQDSGNTYTWHNPDSKTNGGDAGTQNGGSCAGDQCDTKGYVEAVNLKRLCGFSDWRMPMDDELLSIKHLGGSSPVIDSDYFPNTPSILSQSSFWTASPFAGHSCCAYFAFFVEGGFDWSSKGDSHRVRLVRGGQ